MKRYTFIYTNPIPQSKDWNLLYNTALSISHYHKTIYIYHDNFFNAHSTKSFFSLKNLLKNFQQIFNLLFSNFSDVNFYNLTCFPKINNRLFKIHKKIIVTIIKKQPNSILMSIHPNQTMTDFQQLFQVRYTIGDCLDYWEPEQLAFAKNLDLIFTNSAPLYKTCKKVSKKCFLIPSGYYHQKPIRTLFKHKFFDLKSNNILFIGTVNWKYDFDIVYKTAKSLPNHNFHFYCLEVFDFDKKFNNPELNKKVDIAEAKWQKIKKLPNVKTYLSKSEKDLPQIKLKFKAAIIPTRTDNPYCVHCHPIKYYMYKAMRLPIVSTNLLSLQNKCLTSDNALYWVNYINSIKKSNTIEPKKILYQSHQSKAKTIHKIISQNFA